MREKSGAPKKKPKSTSANDKKPKLGRKCYEQELYKLKVELCTLQAWIKHKQLRVIVVFEGRDAAGKGGVIKCITERVSPRPLRRRRCTGKPQFHPGPVLRLLVIGCRLSTDGVYVVFLLRRS